MNALCAQINKVEAIKMMLLRESIYQAEVRPSYISQIFCH